MNNGGDVHTYTQLKKACPGLANSTIKRCMFVSECTRVTSRGRESSHEGSTFSSKSNWMFLSVIMAIKKWGGVGGYFEAERIVSAEY